MLQIDSENGKGYPPVPATGNQVPSSELREATLTYDYSPGLRDLWEIVLRRKWLILGVMLGGFLLTLISGLVGREVLFRAEGSIELSPQLPNVTKFEELSVESLRGEEFVDTQIQLLTSRALAQRVVEKIHLEGHPIFDSSHKRKEEGTALRWLHALVEQKRKIKDAVVKMVGGWFYGEQQTEETPLDSTTVQLKKQRAMENFFLGNLVVEPKGKANILSVAFTSEDPVLSRDAVNTLLDEFIDWQMDRRIIAARSAKVQLEKQMNIARRQLEESESELNSFAKKSGIVSLDTSLNPVYQELEAINSAHAKAEAESIQRKEIFNQARNSDVSTSPLVIQDTLIKELRRQYIELMSEYEYLRVTHKEGYPSLRQLKVRMNEIERKIEAEQNRLLSSLQNEYLAASKVEKALRDTAEKKKALALQLNDVAGRYKIMEREVETNKQIYQSLLERSKEVDANVGTDIANVKIVDFASIPLNPEGSKLPRNLIIALVLGLACGVGLALFLEHLDNTVKRVKEIPDRYWIPLLSVVPLAKREETKNLPSLVRSNPSSPFSEAVRTAKACIKFANSTGNPAKSLVITSTTMGEGKTTLAANLAHAFAASGERVLLMDADLRRPRLHISLGCNGRTKGLSHYLSGAVGVEEIVQRTDVQNLYFICAGRANSSAAELFSRRVMNDLMKKIYDRFDRIIIDSPPFGAIADVLYLGSQVDGVILVATLGNTDGEMLQDLRQMILKANGNIIGCIVNKYDMNRYSTDYRYRYYRSYYAEYQAPGKTG